MSKKFPFVALFLSLSVAALMLYFTKPHEEIKHQSIVSVSLSTAEAEPQKKLLATQTPAPIPLNIPTKVEILESVFESHNDNDPRLDTEFKNLSDSDKVLLQKKYANLDREKLNERGTIVYLLGREIKDSRDLLFLKQVLFEPPCQSLDNCNAMGPAQDDDHSGVNETTLIYPQIMALKSLEKFVESQTQDSALKTQSLEIINNSPF